MRPLTEYAADAARLSLEEFAAVHGEHFLIRDPVSAQVIHGDDFEFHTQACPSSDSVEEEDDQPREPEVAPLRKKPGNLWPRMISIGRNRTNDVALRYASVSKVHAIIRLGDDGSLELVDKGSANGTRHNGTRLDGAAALRVGDRVAFAGIECEFVDATTLMTRARMARES